MPEVLIIPPHLSQARAALIGAGIPVEKHGPAHAALMFAAVAYNRLPQVNRAEELRQELAASRRENDRLALELLREAQQNNNLRARLSQRVIPIKPEIPGFMQQSDYQQAS